MESNQMAAGIHSQLFKLMENPKIRKHLLFYPSSMLNPYCIRLHLRHYIPEISQIIIEQITIDFPENYPSKPPNIAILKKTETDKQIPCIITKTAKIEQQNWNNKSSLAQILTNLIQNLELHWKSYYNFGRNMQFNQLQVEPRQIVRKSQIKQQPLSSFNLPKFQQQKALIFRFQQIVQDLIAQNNIKIGYFCSQIIGSCRLNHCSQSQAILRLISVNDFRDELKKQLLDGRWLNKILKSSASIRCKKQLIKCTNELAKQLFSVTVQQANGNSKQQNNCL